MPSIKILQEKNHKILVVTKDVPSITFLLDKYDISYSILGIKKDGLLAKGFLQLWYNIRCLWIMKSEKIDLMIGSLTAAYMTRLTKIPSILFDDDDDEAQPLMVKYVHPYLSHILSPSALTGNRLRKDTIYYKGYHELAYLYPNRFQPDPLVLTEIGLKQGDPFFVVRFNAFKAHHDIGVEGLSIDNKRKLIALLETKGKVFISNERNIDEEFKKYQLKLSPEKIHSLIYYATMLIGDSQTMTSEAAVMGTPAVKCNTFAGKLSVPNEIEYKYELCYSFLPEQSNKFFSKIEELLSNENLKSDFEIKKEKMLSEKIDVTAFMVWFIENYPQSATIMKDNPDFQNRFK
jgi:predicted glycosyltransferase